MYMETKYPDKVPPRKPDELPVGSMKGAATISKSYGESLATSIRATITRMEESIADRAQRIADGLTDIIDKPDCWNPNNDPYPLCKGKGEQCCETCNLYEDMKGDGRCCD